MIRQRIAQIRQTIDEICRRNDRDPAGITLVAATKYATLSQIQEAIDTGLTDIAENKVQEAWAKFEALSATGRPFTRHMIGHLQTNKVKAAVRLFDLIQSVDSIKLIREIDRRAAEIQRTVPILVEVNTSGERQKFGMPPQSVFSLLDIITGLEYVTFQGLMTVAPFTDQEALIRSSFRGLARLGEAITRRYLSGPKIEMRYLSMGMTNDYVLALEEGANMLRIGSAIFA